MTDFIIKFYLWIPMLIAVYVTLGYLSVQNNKFGGVWFLFSWLISIVPLWAFIARHSKRLLFDGLVFDSLVIIFYTLGVIVFSEQTLKPLHYVAMVIIISGLTLFKLT